ncbi:unnamed protein product [Rhizoctonia solani]|uniref:Uncharacterized protein n=1 Tax=Rhizoctonia solani TaxID=456999 RepID=A0A8H3GFG6_9AGAM|nr:unnamed protein product [Rhizoctonia solani]
MFSPVLIKLLLALFLVHACIEMRYGSLVRGFLESILILFVSYCVARLNVQYAICRTYEATKTLGAYLIGEYEIPGDTPHQVEFVDTQVEVPRSRPKPEALSHVIGQPSSTAQATPTCTPHDEFNYLKYMQLLNEIALLPTGSAQFRPLSPKPSSNPICTCSRILTIGFNATSSHHEAFKPIPWNSTRATSGRSVSQPTAHHLTSTARVSHMSGTGSSNPHANNAINVHSLSRASSSSSIGSRRSTLVQHRSGVVKRAPIKFHPMNARDKHNQRAGSSSRQLMDIVPATPVASPRPGMDTSHPGTPMSTTSTPMTTPPMTPDRSSDSGSSSSSLTPSFSSLSVNGHSATACPTTTAMAGLTTIAGDQDSALDAYLTPEATMSSPPMTAPNLDTFAHGAQTATNGLSIANSTILGSPAPISTPQGSTMVTSTPQESPMTTVGLYISPVTASTPHGTPTRSPIASPTPYGSPPMPASTTSRGSSTVPAQSNVIDAHTGHSASSTPGSLGSSRSQGPNVTAPNSHIPGNDPADTQLSDDDSNSEKSDDEEYQLLETDGLAFALTEQARQQLIRVLKAYLRQRERSAKLRTSTHLQKEVKQLEHHLMTHWPELVDEVGVPRRYTRRVWTARAQGRFEQRAVRGL